MSHHGLNRLQSVVAVQWMESVARTRNIDIEHRFNGQERKIGSFYVDGFCEATDQMLLSWMS
ncbi:hypothetical protein RvY_14854 [Ramazzottius varieornatus]|uniref:Uncharacterized protein n=1 Tax=Ramazzottius varieornatus TaxID=947166 RepID=A0A1D1VSU0_RAMVA|nr:hypothetical protein RvY_14854 [Ramazzottius varieornatus]